MSESRILKGWVFFDEEKASPEVLIIEDLDSFRKFQKQLPERKPSKKQPAPENEDPFRKLDAVDFATERVVIVSRSQTISAHPIYLATDTQSDQVVVWFEIPEPPPEARPYGWGVYRAVVLPQSEKPIVVKFD